MPQAAAAKWVSGAPIADPPREQAVLDRAAAAAEASAVSSLPVREFFALQMHLGRDMQLQLHGDWRRNGCAPCSKPPDLVAFRGEIDRINDAQLRSIYVALPVLQQRGFHGALSAARRRAARGRRCRSRPRASTCSPSCMRCAPRGRPGSTGCARAACCASPRPATTSRSVFEHEGRLRGADIETGARARRGPECRARVRAHAAGRPRGRPGGRSLRRRDERRLRYRRARAAGVVLAAVPGRRQDDRGAVQPSETVSTRSPRWIAGRVRVVVNPGGTNERYVRQHVHRAQVKSHPDNRTAVRRDLRRSGGRDDHRRRRGGPAGVSAPGVVPDLSRGR